MSSSGTGLLLGDVFGLVALALMGATAVLMLLRKRILRRFKNLEAVRRVHVAVASLAGLFLVLHVAYFITWPINLEILLGYVSAALALVVWLTGTAFLERFRDSLYFHGSLSLSGISLMVIHSASAGLNVPFAVAELVLLGTTFTVVFKSVQYIGKLRAGVARR
ncbi:MAG TPA: hypothetical protein VLU99_03850 [Nitrososphaerales archaeon]|nr:hypothetical protein [Nitrososphaerales archaeon]HUK74903.1 hypothetical protein [Nitrososphaerales archaeon]